jgi:hypothetical protein
MRKFIARFRKKSAPVAAPVAHPVETPTFRAVVDAAQNLEVVWGKCVAYEAAGHFTCNEAEALAELFYAIGMDDVAQRFMEGHAYADEDEDDMHHSEYLELTAPALAA